ncbi:MAG TPA: LysR substrate-binding domain-containing protein [Longimicrobium sp.]|nr:LysR substrate-binding domain-containing protein [Longimicrobium sp.]
MKPSTGIRALNYRQLYYFWMVAREGSIAAARVLLGVTQPAVSSQVALLEQSLGTKLFEKSGRGLALTDAGRTVYSYADKIFSLGRDLVEALRRGAPVRLSAGVADSIHPAVVHRLLTPALRGQASLRLELRRGAPQRLAAALVENELHVVLTDQLPSAACAAQRHPLAEAPAVLLGAPGLAERYRARLPRSLDGAPFILPPAEAPQRSALERWFEAAGVTPAIAAEVDDAEVAARLAAEGVGLVAVPALLEAELAASHGLVSLGPVEGVAFRWYALTAERRPRHPAVAALLGCTAEGRREPE